ncbi:hypothetical protein [Marinibacterium profundimaris]|uniref:hypothetical protein n=1 Tax=Marinibacterium profundimaris TaxID=1679460 RepID=UPI000B52336C|nr:hypothetical protein [Marinibacterium profundimaris]
MPRLSIAFSPGLEARADMAGLCRALHGALVASGLFPLAGIRVRAFRADYCMIADALPENDFAAMTLSVGAGRDRDLPHLVQHPGPERRSILLRGRPI